MSTAGPVDAPPAGPDGTGTGSQLPSGPSPLCIVEIASVDADLPRQRAVVVLRERDERADRQLAFAIGLVDASALAYAVHGARPPRPGVHDLASRVVQAFDLEVVAVRLVGRQGQTYFAEVDVRGPSGTETFPCRPSDGLGLAIRQPVPAPMLVDERLFAVDGDVASVSRTSSGD